MTVALVDANFYLNKAMRSSVTACESSSAGFTGGVCGFLFMLQSDLEKVGAYYCACIWDGGYSSRRLSLFPEYKISRRESLETGGGSEFLETLKQQHRLLDPILSMLSVCIVRLPGREGDDVIAWSSRLLLENLPDKIVILSGDYDLLQAVDHRVSVYRTGKSVFVTMENFENEVGISRDKFILMRSLVGEKGRNNVDGVPRIGEVTAKKLLSAPGVTDWISLINHCSRKDASPVERNVIEYFELVCRNMAILDLFEEKFSDHETQSLLRQLSGGSGFVRDRDVIRECSRLGMTSILSKLEQWLATFKRLRTLKLID